VLHALMMASWFGGRLDEAERWAAEVLASAPRGSGLWCAAAHARLLHLVQRADAESIRFGIVATQGVEATHDNAGPLLRLLISLSFTLGLAGQLPLARPYYDHAAAITESLGECIEPGSLGFFFYTRSNWQLSIELSPEQAIRDAEQAIRCFDLAGDRQYEGLARFSLGAALWHIGAFERAEAELRRATEEGAPGAYSTLAGRVFLALALADRGALEDAAREATRALVDTAKADRLNQGGARMAMAYVLLRQGSPAAAEREIRTAVALGSLKVMVQHEFHVLLAQARLAQGDLAEALALAREVSAPDARATRTTRQQGRAFHAEALLAAGEYEAARALFAEVRAEILSIAARIKDEALRETFVTRGPWSARVLRLAEAEGVGAERASSSPASTST
jgi:tetratricopeptide (TPR) repeat protein